MGASSLSASIGSGTTVFLLGYAGSVPSPVVLFLSGVAVLGVAALMTELRRKWS
jgi:hypothetical protein